MSRTKRRDNGPELAVRRRLHAAGLRYRVAHPIPGQRRRTIDIASTRVRLAVFIDGCFWHSCPEHLQMPRANSAWWVVKLETNQLRDLSATAQLEGLGWTVRRFWEHEDPDAVAAAIAEVWSSASGRTLGIGDSSRRG
ncbi:T/G mismatch-specific endonuclease [Klenkia soli]|uniref:T/G mismatch-specific endonuclease n=1 Tax=Klenkia soli TaxID=1052260 RepID=A0A1H0Q2Y2_9ACTN|nr:very short patch repair endonuclease [Klenkia soli]SDP11714.1 T/G mismatch-specific endonuclease [Klenkia soli]